MISTDISIQAINTAIERVKTGQSTYSCNALAVALMDADVADCQSLIRQYVKHSSARPGHHGFEDISFADWDWINPSEKRIIRVQRLSAFRDFLIAANAPVAIEMEDQSWQ